MRLCEHELKIRALLADAGVDGPGVCARALVAHAAGLSRINYILACDQELDIDKASTLNALVARRARGEPLAYILGEKEFYGLPFNVSSATLTPRPETELLIEISLRLLPLERIIFADLGCGCGCIGATLLKERPAWSGILIDSSLSALEVARANKSRLDISAILMAGDIFNLPLATGSLDLVISNPPYIAPSEIAMVMRETLAYEPHCALFSRPDGFRHITAVIAGATRCLKAGGMLILEHGANQAENVKELLQKSGFVEIHSYRDLAGIHRCASAIKGKANV